MQKNTLKVDAASIETPTTPTTPTTLGNLPIGKSATVVCVNGQGALKRRIMEMGITKGTKVTVNKVAPLGDPIEITVRGFTLTLRKEEAEKVQIKMQER